MERPPSNLQALSQMLPSTRRGVASRCSSRRTRHRSECIPLVWRFNYAAHGSMPHPRTRNTPRQQQPIAGMVLVLKSGHFLGEHAKSMPVSMRTSDALFIRTHSNSNKVRPSGLVFARDNGPGDRRRVGEKMRSTSRCVRVDKKAPIDPAYALVISQVSKRFRRTLNSTGGGRSCGEGPRATTRTQTTSRYNDASFPIARPASSQDSVARPFLPFSSSPVAFHLKLACPSAPSFSEGKCRSGALPVDE